MKQGPDVTYYEISYPEVCNLLELGRVGKKDIFFDLGCGKGLAVRIAVKKRRAKRAVGVEKSLQYYESARRNAIRQLNKSQLARVDFWLGAFENEDWSYDDDNFAFNYKKATVVYQSLIESRDDIAFYRKRLRRNVRLLTKDLPLIGYKPTAVNRNSKGCWFYLTKFPERG